MGNRKSREHQKREQDRALWEQARTAHRDFFEDVPLPGIGIRRLQVAFVPSFVQGFAWDIRVRDSTWSLFRSAVSDDAFSEPMTLSGYEELDAGGDMLKGCLDKVRALTLPVGPLFNDMGGADGTVYHLSIFGDNFSEVRFQWWTEFPPQWEPLVVIANDMIETFLRLHPKNV